MDIHDRHGITENPGIIRIQGYSWLSMDILGIPWHPLGSLSPKNSAGKCDFLNVISLLAPSMTTDSIEKNLEGS